MLRAETEADCDAVAALHVTSWQVGYKGMLPDGYLDSLDAAERARQRRERLRLDLPAKTLLAEVDGEIAGFISFGDKRDEEDHTKYQSEIAEIYAIYVHPDHWGKGVADRLMSQALYDLFQTEIQLWVLEANARALRFYARYGLYPDGAREIFTPRGTTIEAPEIRCSLRR